MTQATMARACSSGVPLPPNGVGVPSLTMVPPWPSPLTPTLASSCGWGGGCSGLGGCLPYPVSVRVRRAFAPARGVTPPLLRAGGCSTPPPVPECHALEIHAARGMPPPPPPGSGSTLPPSWSYRAMGAHTAVQGVPPLLLGLACALWARAACPPPPPARAQFVCTAGAGGPPLRPGPGRARGVLRCCVQGFPPVPPLRAVGARCWVGGPSPFPHSAAARLNRV